jgi:HlyD family secretion protein
VATLRQAETNLRDATIRAPISGIVISRNVDPGQTVASALTAPVLFVIAENLKVMRVIASIDEADIDRVRAGQRATFTVDAFPGREFTAVVTEVRNSPVLVQNVVTYEAVLELRNPRGSLRPGMTASVRIENARAKDALRVPNAALRFTPPGQPVSPTPGVWILSAGDAIRRVPVRTGVSDGMVTEVREGALVAGQEVLLDLSPEGRKAVERERTP